MCLLPYPDIPQKLRIHQDVLARDKTSINTTLLDLPFTKHPHKTISHNYFGKKTTMASFLLSLVILFLSIVPGLMSTHLEILSLIDKALDNNINGWSNNMNIKEYPEKQNIQQATTAITRVILENNAVGTLSYLQSKDWSGAVVNNYPTSIAAASPAQFTHIGSPPTATDGSKAAVIYVGPSITGEANKCAFVLAWSTPATSGSPNKIYVETGLSTQYPIGNPAVWTSIENKLESNGGPTFSYTYPNADECALTQATATITAYGNNPLATINFLV